MHHNMAHDLRLLGADISSSAMARTNTFDLYRVTEDLARSAESNLLKNVGAIISQTGCLSCTPTTACRQEITRTIS